MQPRYTITMNGGSANNAGAIICPFILNIKKAGAFQHLPRKSIYELYKLVSKLETYAKFLTVVT